jgi:hypothetical protein
MARESRFLDAPASRLTSHPEREWLAPVASRPSLAQRGALPADAAIVGRHRLVRQPVQPGRTGQRVDGLQVADAAARVGLAQFGVETGVACESTADA